MRLALVFILVLFFPDGRAQTGKPVETRVQLAYYGNNAWNPGIKGAFLILLHKEEDRKLFFESHGGLFYDPGSQLMVFSYHGISFRKVWKADRDLSLGFHPLGISRSFLPETYEYREGSIEKLAFPGNLYYSPELGVGVGKSLRTENLRAYFSVSMQVLIPYNTYVMPLLNLELGIEF